MQQLWLSGCNWDEPAPHELQERWLQIRNSLTELRSIQIPRWTGYAPTASSIQLHGFCDASIHGYAAVVYLRVTTAPTEARTTLLVSKTKVAPLKAVSLPRLELCGAALLSKLLAQVATDIKLNNLVMHAWTDSMITLSWIKGCPNRWKTFIANRTSEIHTHTEPGIWKHVPTKQNPADSASRGILPQQLIDNELWWNGPSWLALEPEHWPRQPTDFTTKEEQRPPKVFLASRPERFDILMKFSSMAKLRQVIAYCRRFINHCKPKSTRQVNVWLSVSELQEAETWILKLAQENAFGQEIKQLQAGPVANRSKLRTLNPFLDESGIIRVGGRIDASSATYNEKHPIILPKNHHVTHLLIEEAHLRTLHGGPQLVLNLIRQKFWIIDARNVIRFKLRRCVTCIRQSPRPQTQIMGDLPSCRINPSLPFQHTGVDYAGPFNIKASKIRNAKILKGYICLFVCMATKAIHLELTTDLTADSFIAALRRFISRRGICSDLYSDCGTNFVKADRQFREAASKEMTKSKITWHFNPPGAPHFGGLWEAGVKSVKTHLKRVLGETSLTYDELYTLLCQIEAVLNSRPLIPIHSDPKEHTLLTPGHFLTGRNLLTAPETTEIGEHTPIKRWEYIQKLNQEFWKIWSKEYLHSLQQRHRWQVPTEDLRVDDIVLIKNEQLPTACWPLARVLEVHKGPDDRVRVAKLQSQNTTYLRPVTKLCKLLTNSSVDEPLQNNSSSP